MASTTSYIQRQFQASEAKRRAKELEEEEAYVQKRKQMHEKIIAEAEEQRRITEAKRIEEAHKRMQPFLDAFDKKGGRSYRKKRTVRSKRKTHRKTHHKRK